MPEGRFSIYIYQAEAICYKQIKETNENKKNKEC